MAEIKDGGPAFPSHSSMGEIVQDGMSLRDYFAAKAMQSKLLCEFPPKIPKGMSIDEYVANQAYLWADAMLKAREVQNG